MNSIVSWECLSVAEFLHESNWHGSPFKQEKPLAIDLQEALENWQMLSTKEFFNFGNWEGHSSSTSYSDRQPREFSITLPVAEFFQCFGWYGNSTVYSNSETKPAISTTKQITVDRLSQLF
jgi:hypothetical protein